MIIIVGAGISGLAAAFELRRRRVPFQVLEASDRAGGLIRTEHLGGYTIDAGADSMLAAKPAARALCGELALEPSIQNMSEPRTAYVLARDRLFPLPSPSVLGLPLTFRAASRFTLLPMRARMRVLLERFVPPAPAADESVASLFRRRFGAATVGLVAQPLLGGIHAGDVEELSATTLFPTLGEAERSAGSILRGLGNRHPPSSGAFFSLVEGMETLPAAIVRALPAEAVRYGAAVRAIASDRGEWRVDTEGGGHRAAAVLLACPMHVSARLLQAVDADAGRLCAAIGHTSTACVALGWPRAAVHHPLHGSGFVVSPVGSRFRVTACTWVSSKWEGRAPPGHVLLRAFIGGARDRAAVDLPDEDLVSIACEDLSRALRISGPPEIVRVYRWRDASPQLVVGHDRRIRSVEDRLSAHAGLFMTGRGFRAVGIPDCVADARRAAGVAADFVTRSHRG
jgi:oxygen-dependent protoporphyrinogen oxidase